jgi:hypothetical protein
VPPHTPPHTSSSGPDAPAPVPTPTTEPTRAARRLPGRHRLERTGQRFTREVGVAAALTLTLGLGAAQTHQAEPATDPVAAQLLAGSAAATLADAAAAHGPEEGAPAAPAAKAGTSGGKAVKAATKTPASKPAAKKVDRWLPVGTGMWLHDWRRSENGHANEVVARAEKVGLTHLFVQTGSSKKGWIGDEVLGQLLPATSNTDIKVIAWDFPKLVNPVADARRMAKAALYRKAGAPRVAAVAPDVETGAEGTHLSARGIDLYYSTLRKLIPKDVAILPTVPWPSEHRLNSYPYDRTAKYADAIIPMAYWYNRSPSRVTATSMKVLARYKVPVMPVGQGYDGRLDAPYLRPDPAPDKSVQAFLTVAKFHGARSVSLWSWQTTGALQWKVLAGAGRAGSFLPKAPPAPAAPATPWSTRGRAPRSS